MRPSCTPSPDPGVCRRPPAFAPDAHPPAGRGTSPIRTVGGVSGELISTANGARRSRRPSATASAPTGSTRSGCAATRRSSVDASASTGAIYAMRRWLWQPLPADTMLDDVLGADAGRAARLPRRLRADGPRLRSRRRATRRPNCGGRCGRSPATFSCCARTAAAASRTEPGLAAVRVAQAGRLFVPYALIALFVSSAALAAAPWFYALAFAAQALFYGLAVYGAAARSARAADAGAGRGGVP